MGGLYLTAAYELHSGVNRSSDGIGSNSPYYDYLVATEQPADRLWRLSTPLRPNIRVAAAAGSPPYLTDIANEYAFKFGGQYRFDFGLTIDALYEDLHAQRAGGTGVPERAPAHRRLAGPRVGSE